MSIIKSAIGFSSEKEPAQAANEAVSEAKKKLNEERIDLALVFATSSLSVPSLTKSLYLLLGDIPIIGCSCPAVISRGGIFKNGVAILLINLPQEIYINAAAVKEISKRGALEAGEELGERLLYGSQDIRRDLSIIFSDAFTRDGAQLIAGLQEKLGTSFPLIGSSNSDYLRLMRTFLFFKQDIINDAACGVLFGGKLSFGLGIKHGWQPIGKPREVTKSKDNFVFEIDGKSAVSLYQDYFGYDLEKLKKELKHISILYPLGIYLAGEEEYLLRNILAIERGGTLVFQGDIPENSRVRLMIATEEACISAAQQAINEAKKGLFGKPISFIIILDSLSRYILLGRDAHKEIEAIKENIDESVPLIGFYTYGEQAPLTAIDYKGKTYFHNHTITALAIGG